MKKSSASTLCGRGAWPKRRSDLEANLNLYAAHLALDAHPEVGNHAELARCLGLAVTAWWGNANGIKLAALATAPHGVKLGYLVDRFEKHVGPIKLVQSYVGYCFSFS